jgi:hypothetical protein
VNQNERVEPCIQQGPAAVGRKLGCQSQRRRCLMHVDDSASNAQHRGGRGRGAELGQQQPEGVGGGGGEKREKRGFDGLMVVCRGSSSAWSLARHACRRAASIPAGGPPLPLALPGVGPAVAWWPPHHTHTRT